MGFKIGKVFKSIGHTVGKAVNTFYDIATVGQYSNITGANSYIKDAGGGNSTKGFLKAAAVAGAVAGGAALAGASGAGFGMGATGAGTAGATAGTTAGASTAATAGTTAATTTATAAETGAASGGFGSLVAKGATQALTSYATSQTIGTVMGGGKTATDTTDYALQAANAVAKQEADAKASAIASRKSEIAGNTQTIYTSALGNTSDNKQTRKRTVLGG